MFLKNFMNRNVGIATAIGIGIIIVVIAYQINETTHYVTSPEDYEKSIEQVQFHMLYIQIIHKF